MRMPAALGAVLGLAPAAGAGARPRIVPGPATAVQGFRLASIAALGPRTAIASARSTSALWIVHRARGGALRVGGCVRPPFQRRCAPARQELDFPAPTLLAGRDVYAADSKRGVLVHWRRGGGTLHYRGCLSPGRVRGCRDAGASSPDLAERLVLVRHGRLLAAGSDLGGVALFTRDPATGRLDPAGCLGPHEGCRDGVLPEEPGMWIAGSGNWLAVGGGDSLTAVDPGVRGAASARRGDCLTGAGTAFAEADAMPGCRPDVHASGDPDFGMTLFAHGRFVYGADFVTGGIGMAIGWWRRSATGRLTFAGCLGEEATRGPGCRRGSGAIEDPRLFAAGPGLLAVAGTTAQGVAVLARDGRTGGLRLGGCVTPTGGTGNPYNPSLGPAPPPSCRADPRVADVSGIALRSGVLWAASGRRILTFSVSR